MQNRGFTLLELSIVIVIIGLIVAGISAGQSLVRQAQLRQVVSDFNNYRVAYNSFKLQYDAIPGDFAAAQDYWGVSADNGSNQNAKGNGVIGGNESEYVWMHLMLAGLMSGDFDGSSFYFAPINNARYRAVNTVVSDADGMYGHLYNAFVLQHLSLPAPLSVIEAQAIDKKTDDGFANTGKVHATPGGATGGPSECTTLAWNETGINASYNLDASGLLCRISFNPE